MTRTSARYRSGPLLVALAAALMGLSWASSAPEIGGLKGSGLLTQLGCAGCAAGALFGVASGGMGFVIWALWTPTGSAAVAGCAGVCLAAVTE